MGCVEAIEFALRDGEGVCKVCERKVLRCLVGGAKVSVVGGKGKVGGRATV
jgi:hypothetical protein